MGSVGNPDRQQVYADKLTRVKTALAGTPLIGRYGLNPPGLAAGCLAATQTAQQIAATRAAPAGPFGVNLFVPTAPTPPEDFRNYLDELRVTHEVGEPIHDADDWDAELELLTTDPVPVVSFTFSCPTSDDVEALHAVGSEAWVTVTSVPEAELAAAAGADVLIAQGAEAGGHRAGFVDRIADDLVDPLGVLALLQLLRARTDRPLVAAGGIATDTPTALTRAFTGRSARGLRNRFLIDHTSTAPAAYPEIHHATAPLRAAARQTGNLDEINLWAGQTHCLAPEALERRGSGSGPERSDTTTTVGADNARHDAGCHEW